MLKSVNLSFNAKILILDDANKKYNINSTPRETLLDYV